MASQRKMLSSGTAASRRSASVCSAGVVRAVTTAIRESVGSYAEDGARMEVGFATDEAAGNLCKRAGVDAQPEALARRVGNRDEHSPRTCPRPNSSHLPAAPENGHAPHSPPPP